MPTDPDPTLPAQWGTGTAPTLNALRTEIDRVDAALVTLLAERARYTRDAARFKASLAEVSAPARVDQVLDRVRSRAVAAGLPLPIAEAVWRALITASIEDQRAWYLAHAPAPGERDQG
ncbi:MAG: chorismate mutase [Alphaproteobacteria bacterium]|nr:MAG: chorismate mutase [Alphaproteobacteria bacterium]